MSLTPALVQATLVSGAWSACATRTGYALVERRQPAAPPSGLSGSSAPAVQESPSATTGPAVAALALAVGLAVVEELAAASAAVVTWQDAVSRAAVKTP